MTRENLQKTIKNTITNYKEIIIGVSNSVCIELLEDIVRKLARDNVIMDSEMMIDKIIGEE